MDEEFWPFKDDSLDLIINNMNMHWVNDLSVALSRMLSSLKEDGNFFILINHYHLRYMYWSCIWGLYSLGA